MNLEDVQIDCITIGKDRREAHPEKVKTLADSIRRIGLLHPIGITPAYELVYGRHRLEAFKAIGRKTIACQFIKDGFEELAEVDENLERSNLDALEFSRAVARRKKIWERLHPETRQHVAGAEAKHASDKLSLAEKTPCFAESTATVANVSRRTVERAASIGEKLSDEAEAVVKDTPIADNQKALAAIAAKPKGKQVAAAKSAVKKGKAPKATKPAPEPEHWLDPLQEPYENAIKSIHEASRLVKAIAGDEKAGAHLAHLGTFTHIKKNLDEAVQHIKANKPAAGCPKCGDYEIRGKGCKQCYGTGFISAVVHKGLTAKV